VWHARNLLRCAEPIGAIGYGVAGLCGAMAAESEWCFSEYNMTAVTLPTKLQSASHSYDSSHLMSALLLMYPVLLPVKPLLLASQLPTVLPHYLI